MAFITILELFWSQKTFCFLQKWLKPELFWSNEFNWLFNIADQRNGGVGGIGILNALKVKQQLAGIEWPHWICGEWSGGTTWDDKTPTLAPDEKIVLNANSILRGNDEHI
jgi:hypothetical protein